MAISFLSVNTLVFAMEKNVFPVRYKLNIYIQMNAYAFKETLYIAFNGNA
jgi:hypothetical protein